MPSSAGNQTGAGLIQQPHRGAGNRDGSMQDGGFILLPASCWSLAQMKNPSLCPNRLKKKPHQTRPCPILSTPAVPLNCCILPQIKPSNPSYPRLEPLQPPETKALGRDRAGQALGWFWWLGRAWQSCSSAQTELGAHTARPKNSHCVPRDLHLQLQKPPLCSQRPSALVQQSGLGCD